MRTAIALFCAATMNAFAGASEDINEIRVFEPLDLFGDDDFGYSIAASLTRVVTGSPRDNLAGENAGAIYINVIATGQQLFKLTANDASSDDNLGFSVAATGQRAIAGAPSADSAGNNSGAAYIFNIQNGQQVHKLVPSDTVGGDRFGESVSASGARVIIGAAWDDDRGTQSGSAYIFDTGTGQQLRKLTASDGAPFNYFGSAVAISGTLAIIGAYWNTHSGTDQAGAAYIFDATTGNQLRKLIPSDPQPNGVFGRSVAISGNLVVVGSRGGDPGGAAYVFNAITGEQLHKLTPSMPSDESLFADDVAISGNRIVVGARGERVNGTRQGAAYVFDAETGQEIYRLVASDGEPLDALGASVAAIGNLAFIGDPGLSPNPSDPGAAYIFDITPCFADVNGDNAVNLADLNIILAGFGQTTTIGDTNFDGVIDLADLNRVLSEFGIDCPQ